MSLSITCQTLWLIPIPLSHAKHFTARRPTVFWGSLTARCIGNARFIHKMVIYHFQYLLNMQLPILHPLATNLTNTSLSVHPKTNQERRDRRRPVSGSKKRASAESKMSVTDSPTSGITAPISDRRATSVRSPAISAKA